VKWTLALTLGALAACSSPARLGAPLNDTDWEACFARANGWNGGDIAHALEIGGGRTLWLFGDSIVGPVREGARVGGESKFVRGAIAWHATPARGAAPESIAFAAEQAHDGVPRIAWAAPSSSDWPADSWCWLMGDGALVRNDEGDARLVLFVSVFGPAGNPEGMWNFRRLGGQLVSIENPAYAPQEWRATQRANPLVESLPRHAEAPRRSDDWGAAVVAWPAGRAEPDRRTLYVFGVRTFEDRDRGLLLARCPEAALERPESWEFFDGAAWTREARAARELLRGVPDEFTVQRVVLDGRDTLVLVHSEPMLGRRTLARTASSPTGPWSAPSALFEAPEPANDRRLLVYASKGHADLSRPGELLISYAVNSTDFGQVFADASLYRPRFVRVPLAKLPRPPDQSTRSTR
jgi:hypothetical protein